MAGERIFCVDDDVQALGQVAAHLAGLGYRVSTAADGGEALPRILADPPDLLVTDLQMPFLDGAGLCRSLRRNPATMGLPILVVSGHQRVGEVARRARADGWLSKPFDPRALADEVARLLKRGLPDA